jgi:DNA-binding MarR family transcriptional regulator
MKERGTARGKRLVTKPVTAKAVAAKSASARQATPKRGLAKADYESLAEFRYLLRRFAAFSEQAAREAGLTAQHHQALLAVKGFPGRERITIGELAERLNLRHHSVVGLVDRLVARGMLRRERDPEDGRRVVIGITPTAQELLVGLSLVHRDELRRLAPLLQTLLQRLSKPSV